MECKRTGLQPFECIRVCRWPCFGEPGKATCFRFPEPEPEPEPHFRTAVGRQLTDQPIASKGFFVSRQSTMSSYENYEVASASYDDGRIPVGTTYFLGIIRSYLNKPLNEVRTFPCKPYFICHLGAAFLKFFQC